MNMGMMELNTGFQFFDMKILFVKNEYNKLEQNYL